jgi:hypothetical protein
MTAEAPVPAPRPLVSARVGSQIFLAAWLAIGVAIALELLIALGLFLALQRSPGQYSFLASVANRITWSTIVCTGLAFAKAFAPAQPARAALAGLLAAPAAFATARAVHKGVAQAVGLAAGAAATWFVLLLATIRGLEYGALGALLAWLDRRNHETAWAYLGTGALVALVFGGLMLGAMARFGAPAATAEWISRGINEALFPLGCAMVLYASGLARRHVAQ